MKKKQMVYKKWTFEILYQLYCQLVERFGPVKSWGLKSMPKFQKAEFEAFMEDWNRVYDSKPLSQLGWAISRSDIGYCAKGKKQAYNHRNLFRNKLAAYAAGFIDDDLFADELIMKYKPKVVSIGIDALNAFIEEANNKPDDDILEFDI